MTPHDLPETLRRAEQWRQEATDWPPNDGRKPIRPELVDALVACVTALRESQAEASAYFSDIGLCMKCGQGPHRHGDFGFRDHAFLPNVQQDLELAEAELTKLREERDRLQERCDVLEPGARNYNQMRLRADAAERRVQALEAALMAAREAFDAHDHWCGYNPQAPGDPSFRRAAFLIDAALTAADPATTQA